MPDDRRIDLSITADDQASKVLDDVAKKVEGIDDKVEVDAPSRSDSLRSAAIRSRIARDGQKRP